MNKSVILSIFLLASINVAAQDVVVKKDGSTILAKVLEVNQDNIKYKKFSNPNGPTYAIGLSDVMAVNYENGDKDNFNKRMFVIPFFTFFYALVFAIFLNPAYGILQMCTIFTIPLLKRYNNKPGNCKWIKWFFYIIYPAHLIICGLIRLALHGDIQVIG